ncbi:hypothetical protein BEWA_024650 [Theileria equi strain WA]|uniref:MACPF domain-containing protein n=1 Tax=Theileria equi strain WA TaxID=1537102 RepID=L0AX65_THEEQ|nr:hypothetical protein BEWA_024650 [Theileria equi strain WA]AFZ79616.1 hypothetical protein BEWA_024650 [Theileria equi strain WA]|eukprot:XP_004829282.1 hypothetical protein BEWA_024650 [Theileria equi strain WA]
MGFTTEIKRLKDAIANGRKNGCSYKLYGKRICARVIGEWRTFFDNFGTHIITRIVLGGKMRMSKLLDSTKDAKQSKLDAGIKADFDSKNVKVKAEANLGKNQSLENNNNSRGNEFTLEGGNMTDTSHLKLDVWSKSLKEAPIPIKVVLTSYVQFFENLELGKEYIQAMNILVVKSDKRRNLRT